MSPYTMPPKRVFDVTSLKGPFKNIQAGSNQVATHTQTSNDAINVMPLLTFFSRHTLGAVSA